MSDPEKSASTSQTEVLGGESSHASREVSFGEIHSNKAIHLDAQVAGDLITPQVSRTSEPYIARKVTSNATAGTSDPEFEVDFEEDDSSNPRTWSLGYKGMCIGFLSWNTWVV